MISIPGRQSDHFSCINIDTDEMTVIGVLPGIQARDLQLHFPGNRIQTNDFPHYPVALGYWTLDRTSITIQQVKMVPA